MPGSIMSKQNPALVTRKTGKIKSAGMAAGHEQNQDSFNPSKVQNGGFYQIFLPIPIYPKLMTFMNPLILIMTTLNPHREWRRFLLRGHARNYRESGWRKLNGGRIGKKF